MVSSIIWLQLADLNDLTRRNGEQGFGAGRHEGQQIPHAIGFCTEDDDGYLPPGHVLLVLDPAVAGEQDVPPSFGYREELTVLLRPVSCPTYGFALMAHRGEHF